MPRKTKKQFLRKQTKKKGRRPDFRTSGSASIANILTVFCRKTKKKPPQRWKLRSLHPSRKQAPRKKKQNKPYFFATQMKNLV